jgi:hypothetical protein
MSPEEKKALKNEQLKAWRARRRLAGIKPKPYTEEQKRKKAASIAERRQMAKANGVVLASDRWFKENPEKHRARVARWKDENRDYARVLDAESQERRRSTPWGRINNRMWPIVHFALRRGSSALTRYTEALGYTWDEARSHIEAQFYDGMSWSNWGEVWELDHIVPLSSFRYESIHDPKFRECWGLSNIRPLPRGENRIKSNRLIE